MRTVSVKRVVVKVGTKLITGANGLLDEEKIDAIVAQITVLRERGVEVILVTSGAIGAGMGALGLKKRPTVIPELQACAAIGQNRLMDVYDRLFSRRAHMVAQVLLTWDDMQHRKRYLNARTTIVTLLQHRVVPIINENDTVSIEEIKFGDNDRLAGLVATLIEADHLIILSTVKGLYNGQKELVCRVDAITGEVKSWAQASCDGLGTGGMITKLSAAEDVTASGIACAIADGNRADVLIDIIEGRDGEYTAFMPKKKKLKARKNWLKLATRCAGTVVVDAGARDALVQGNKSLLPGGIVAVKGTFPATAVVDIADEEGAVFAKGISAASAADLTRYLLAKKEQKRDRKKDGTRKDAVIHRDDLVIF